MAKKLAGRAYAFFDCRASKKQIKAELPTIREFAQIPPLLELSLSEKPEEMERQAKLLPSDIRAKVSGSKYFMKAKLPDATNKETADELAAILNQAYQSPLYDEGEPFFGEICYKEGNTFVCI